MIFPWLKIWRPAAYQGQNKKGNYFEGWFFKVVDAAQRNVFAFIPGIFIGKDPGESQAFIQVLDGIRNQSTYHRFPASDFRASTRELDILIGPNRFRGDFLELDIESPERTIRGRLEFGRLNPWPIKLFSPGIMGWYSFIPKMECYHGVLSFDHDIQGSISVNNRSLSFEGGKGYIEKDWGTSFPSAYVWVQSNHFEQPGISIVASVAKIPWRASSFRGFIIGLWMRGRLKRFATYTGAVLDFCRIGDTDVHIQVHDKNHLLDIKAERTEGSLLHAPYDFQMLEKVRETLSSRAHLKLAHLHNGIQEVVFQGTGQHAGLDVNGNVEEISR